MFVPVLWSIINTGGGAAAVPVCVGVDSCRWCHSRGGHLPPGGGSSAPWVVPAWPVDHLEDTAGAGPRQAPPPRLRALPEGKKPKTSSWGVCNQRCENAGWVQRRVCLLSAALKLNTAETEKSTFAGLFFFTETLTHRGLELRLWYDSHHSHVCQTCFCHRKYFLSSSLKSVL